MIKIDITSKILGRHKKYLEQSYEIKEFDTFRNSKPFNKAYVEKLFSLDTNNLLENYFKKVENINKTNSNKYLIKCANKLNHKHIKFTNYILKNIRDLKNCNLLKCSSDEKICLSKGSCLNLFLATPKELDYIESTIINKEYKVIKLIFELEDNRKISNDDKYSKKVFDLLKYDLFSKSKLTDFYKYEMNIIEKMRKKSYLTTFIKNIKLQQSNMVIYKTGNSYNSKFYEKILSKLVIEINNIKDTIIKIYVYPEINNILENCITEISDKIKESFKNLDEFINDVNGILVDLYNKMEKIIESSNINVMIINYHKYKQKYKDSWSAYDLVLDLGLKTCPYCNRQYVAPMYSEKGKMRADLDHFFPKFKYPYFSMSIFNLVPACKFCNSSLKGKIDFNYNKNINPYEYGFENLLKFSYKPMDYDSYTGKKGIEIFLDEIPFADIQLIKKAKNNASTFGIDSLYNYHRDEVYELIKKRIIYNESYIKMLKKQYRELFGVNSSEMEIIQFVIGNYLEEKNLSKKVLAKLTRDIVEELGFIDTKISKSDIEKLKKLL